MSALTAGQDAVVADSGHPHATTVLAAGIADRWRRVELSEADGKLSQEASPRCIRNTCPTEK
ncbi:hypothetical protein D3C83_167880 [compost metagenome]